jgi:hypothetical protein
MTLVALSMTTPTYDPKVGWSSLTSVTGGTMPTYDEFSDRFYTVCADNLFSLGNDNWCSSVLGILGWEWC